MKLSDFRFKHPAYLENHYISPPPIVRYTIERWDEEQDATQATAEFFGHTNPTAVCAACGYGPFCLGEWVIDDTLGIDMFHVRCCSPFVRVRAFIGNVLCTFRAILGIDKHV